MLSSCTCVKFRTSISVDMWVRYRYVPFLPIGEKIRQFNSFFSTRNRFSWPSTLICSEAILRNGYRILFSRIAKFFIFAAVGGWLEIERNTWHMLQKRPDSFPHLASSIFRIFKPVLVLLKTELSYLVCASLIWEVIIWAIALISHYCS